MDHYKKTLKELKLLFISSQKKRETIKMVRKMVTSYCKGDIVGPPFSQVSLMCPVSLTRIKVPSRGRNCAHIQCIDMQSALSLRFQRNRLSGKIVGLSWFTCPICKLKIEMKDLCLDELMLEIVCTTGQDEHAVNIYRDGRWEVHKETKKEIELVTID